MSRTTNRPGRRKTLKDAQREQTRTKLLAAAKRLFELYGYDDVSVTEIAREAGVTHSMINVYFGGKAGLVYELVRQNNDHQYARTVELARSEASARDRLADIIGFWMQLDGENPKLASVLHAYSWQWPPETEQENDEDIARFRACIAEVIREGQQTGELGCNADPALAAKACFALYTWGMRPVVLLGKTVDEAHDETMAMIDLVLCPGPAPIRS